MASRPKKEIEYFPHFLKDSATIRALEMLYNNDGYAVWFKLLEVLGSNPDFKYVAQTKEQCDKLLEKFKIDGKLMSKIINTLCDLNAIDKDKWKKERTLFVPNLVHNIEKVKTKKTVNTNTNLIESEKKLYLDYVYLKDDEYKKLVNKFGKETTDDWIEKANLWIGQSPDEKKRREMRSHYFMILNWDRMDKDRKKQNNNQQSKKQPQYKNVSELKFD